jgi:hypothetical protein
MLFTLLVRLQSLVVSGGDAVHVHVFWTAMRVTRGKLDK